MDHMTLTQKRYRRLRLLLLVFIWWAIAIGNQHIISYELGETIDSTTTVIQDHDMQDDALMIPENREWHPREELFEDMVPPE